MTPTSVSVRRQQKRKPVDVSTEDPLERKRVLNVLAQRRYRQRKRQKQQQLESLVNGQRSQDVNGGNDSRPPNETVTAESISDRALPIEQGSSSESSVYLFSSSSSDPPLAHEDIDFDFNFSLGALDTIPPFCFDPSASASATTSTLSSTNHVRPSIPSQATGNGQSPEAEQSAPLSISPAKTYSPSPSLSDFLQLDDATTFSFPDDFQLAVPELDLLRAALSIATRLHTVDRLWDVNATSIFAPVAPDPSGTAICGTSGCSADPSSGSSSFPSSRSDLVLDTSSASTCEPPSSLDLTIPTPSDPPPWTQILPSNLRPTPAQLSTPHHPILDILPWPTVRTKLITAFSLPPALLPKHPVDGSTVSVLRLAYDLEDGGCRVWGPDPTAESGWEVTQGFADRWWWCLDSRVIRVADGWRRGRGEGELKIGGARGLSGLGGVGGAGGEMA